MNGFATSIPAVPGVGETVIIHRAGPPGEPDRYGDPKPGPVEHITVPGCIVAPRTSSEDNRARQAVIVGLSLYPPPDVRIEPADRVEVRGALYEVDGEPGVWTNTFANVPPAGIEVALRRVEG